MATTPSARSGCRDAQISACHAAKQTLTRTARSTSSWSITAMVSAMYSRSPYAAGSVGRSERPFPRGSMVTTRKCRAR